jgi:hypothetical protein
MAKVFSKDARLTGLDQILLVIPAAFGLVFGLASFLLAPGVAGFAGYAGNDQFFYWLGGAAVLGYGVSLAVGIGEASWRGVRAITIAEVVFSVVALFACLVEILGGAATGFVVLVGVVAVAQLIIAVVLLNEHRDVPTGQPDIPGGAAALGVMSIAIVAATVFGALGAFLPLATTHFFGYKGTEDFIYRVAGAATLGYAVMGGFNVRSRNWREVRLPVLMAIVFNGVSFFAALRAILQSDPLLMPIIVALATFAVTAPMIYAYVTIQPGD